MAEQGFQERTEKATQQRRKKARDRGQVAKSMELNSAAMICLGFLTIYAVGPYLAGHTQDMMRYTMANAPMLAAADPTFYKMFGDNLMKFLLIMAPIFVIFSVIAFGANVAQIGFKITPKAMEPKWEKLNVLKGIKRLFSLKSLVQLIRDSLKMGVVGFVAYKVISSEFVGFFKLSDMTVAQVAATMGTLAMELALKVGAVILAIAILDFIYQRYEFEKSIKMSKQDLKDEHKQTEGSPQNKSRMRQAQMQLARSRMMQAVPLADVVVTNPTHYAVAIKYEPDKSNAPYVLAKGQRLIAQQIKAVALEHDIPIVEDKPLARALFKMCEVGQSIPATLYRAVAELLAYVYRLNGKVMS
ncbi:MAG: flagellar biosynthesis protein FlhB [candidate division Zixibacteria bacterium]|nr:flagellar biosynthesis protein FlhB [candidate division Zixibacteria bacterium]